MLRRSRGDCSGDAVETLLKKRAQRPARAVSREHVEIVDVQIALAMGPSRFFAEHFIEPVVRDELSCRIEHEPAYAIALVCVRVHAPVGAAKIIIDRRNRVYKGALGVVACGHGALLSQMGWCASMCRWAPRAELSAAHLDSLARGTSCAATRGGHNM